MTKRSKQQMRAARAPSPYFKARKVPYRYSDDYRAWRDAVMRGDPNATAHASRVHARKFASVQ